MSSRAPPAEFTMANTSTNTQSTPRPGKTWPGGYSIVNKRYNKPSPTFEEHKRDYAGWTNSDLQAYLALPRKQQLRTIADPFLGRPVVPDEHMTGLPDWSLVAGLVVGAILTGLGSKALIDASERKTTTSHS